MLVCQLLTPVCQRVPLWRWGPQAWTSEVLVGRAEYEALSPTVISTGLLAKLNVAISKAKKSSVIFFITDKQKSCLQQPIKQINTKTGDKGNKKLQNMQKKAMLFLFRV